ncbi:MAG: patatin-like phospholipase family protein [Gammaproteobacteria bacterium]|nr:patatin-like phospholipase family protein [Gammaproteobacteria bacterium]
MALSEGQRSALAQLRRIAGTDRSPIRIVGVDDEPPPGACLSVDISLDCTHYPRVEGGLPLRDREGITLSIPEDFPFRPPTVDSVHTRFHGFGHVQWGTHLCIYLSTETQWIPSQGMFGFLAQLDEWFRRGARNELDDPEGPLHPPVAYPVASTSICVNANTPGSDTWPWFGAAILHQPKPAVLEVQAWSPLNALPDHLPFAPTVLLNFELPFEYPRTVQYLFDYLEAKARLGYRLLAHMMIASERIPDGVPLYVGIGAPSRGVAGNPAQRNQHLTFWKIEPGDVAKLRAASIACQFSSRYTGQDTPAAIQALIDSILDSLLAWRREARVRWCRVIENRPEIITRRDEGTPMDWFRGKRVALWGCGAIGGFIAEHLARAGVSRLTLSDRARVTPGLLVRQNFSALDTDETKSAALAERLLSIAPNVQVTPRHEDIVSQTLASADWDADVDLIIDATASLQVRSKLEAMLKEHERQVPVATVMISATAHHAVAVLAPIGYRAGPLDALRRLGIAAIARGWLSDWAEAFWTREAIDGLRQPEPGCSDPTFVASHADVAALSAQALNTLAQTLAQPDDAATGVLISRSLDLRKHQFRFRPDIRWVADGIDFRMSENAWRDITGWIRAGTRERTAEYETGGLLFGELDETLGIAWVTNVSGPPRDSTFSPEGFVCGTHGTKALCDDYNARTQGIVRYVGTWHSHPVGTAKPSLTDYAGIADIFAAAPDDGAHQMMAIVGHSARTEPELGAYTFHKQELAALDAGTALTLAVRGGITTPPTVAALDKSIGLSLSGGGSRAVAFHLGTLRALEDLNLLDEVDVISGVSGGSVMTGLLGYTEAPFDLIDRDTVHFLRRGLVVPGLTKLFHPARAAALAWNLAFVAAPTLLCDLLTGSASRVASLFPGLRGACSALSRTSWPIRRSYSRTHVLADAIADVVGPQRCDAPTRQRKSIVFNACELRTGTAFRMSNQRFGSYRYGWAPAAELRVADAVMASAAYPPFLPPFDWKRPFELNGKTDTHRVIVTDGGVFENLGVTVMEPGRDPEISAIGYNVDIIIASDAGAGQFTGESVPISWPKRMTQVVSAVMRKVQDATKQRLHDHAKAGRIDGFVYAGLGQIDRRVPLKPANWVDRQEVIRYPTDFSAMSEVNIQRLSGRGEAITRALVTQYLLSD